MKLTDLGAAQQAELQEWGRGVAAKFEAEVTPTPGAVVPPLVELRRLRHQRREIDQLTQTRVDG